MIAESHDSSVDIAETTGAVLTLARAQMFTVIFRPDSFKAPGRPALDKKHLLYSI
jgi:hypothetical protein